MKAALIDSRRPGRNITLALKSLRMPFMLTEIVPSSSKTLLMSMPGVQKKSGIYITRWLTLTVN